MANEENASEFDPFASEKKKSGRGGGWLAALALLVALGVAGWNGWQWWQARGAVDEGAELEAALARIDAQQAEVLEDQRRQAGRLAALERLELEEGLARLDEAVGQARSVAGSDRARLAGLERAQEELLQRFNALESRVGALVVRDESPRQALELAEVDYLLRSANERLRLYGDVRTANQALALADAQLAALDDPVYISVRQAITAARLSLEEVTRPDAIALTEAIGQLQARVPALPFPGQVTTRADDGAVEAVEDPGIWARFKAALGGLVTVRRRTEGESLVSLEDKDYVRQGLWSQLETARLALLREDDETWTATLERASALLDEYFDADAPEVERFEAGLDRLSAVSLGVDWPDISEPWTRLQGIRSVPEAPAAPAVEDVAGMEPPGDGAGAGSETGGASDDAEAADSAAPDTDPGEPDDDETGTDGGSGAE